jgi:TetR/AcrR family transcriptional regulator, transcriptional repressor of bet genes
VARQRDLAGHQERLSAATWAVLAEEGLAGLTVRAVAERAGCTTGLVMHTFPDKRALLRHARELLHRRTAERADRAEAGSAHPRDRLRAVLEQAAALTPEKLEEARVWLGFSAAAVADPELADLHARHHRVFQDRVARLVGQVAPDRDAGRRGATARALVAMTEGLSTLAALDPAGYSPAVQERAIDAALAALDG